MYLFKMDRVVYPVGPGYCNHSTNNVDFDGFTNHYKNFGVFTKYGAILSLFSVGILYLSKSFYKKHQTNTALHSNKINIPGPHPIVYHLSAIFLPLVIFHTLLFAVFKQCVKIYLIFKHGDKFGGFYYSADSVWWVQEETCSSIVPLLLIVKSKDQCDMVKKVKKRIKDKIFNTEDYPKLISTCNFCCGYPYMILNQYTLEECVRTFENPDDDGQKFDETYLSEFISRVGATNFTKKDASWEVFVTNRCLDTKEAHYSYPLLIKFNHAVADGVAMVTFIIKLFGDAVPEQYVRKVVDKYLEEAKKGTKKNDDFRKQAVKLAKVIRHQLNLLYITMGRIIWAVLIRQKDKSALHGAPLSGSKIAVFAWENQQELVPLVKNIKNRVPNCTFSDVVYTALSISLTDFYTRNNSPIPKKISSIVPIILSYREVMQPGPVKLFNKLTITVLELPTHQGDVCETLERVKQESWVMKHLPEVEMNYWLLNYIAGAIPLPILKKTLNIGGLTQAMSNVPGASRTVVLDGCEITNVACFPPHRWKTGLSMTFITYDNKFQMGLIVDKALISSRDEAQRIVNDILQNIRQIDEETCRFYGK